MGFGLEDGFRSEPSFEHRLIFTLPPLPFLLLGSEKGVVAGVEKAIGGMKMKEYARITVQPQYAYGEEGNKELGIPGGAELVYEVRLNNFTKVRIEIQSQLYTFYNVSVWLFLPICFSCIVW